MPTSSHLVRTRNGSRFAAGSYYAPPGAASTKETTGNHCVYASEYVRRTGTRKHSIQVAQRPGRCAARRQSRRLNYRFTAAVFRKKEKKKTPVYASFWSTNKNEMISQTSLNPKRPNTTQLVFLFVWTQFRPLIPKFES